MVGDLERKSLDADLAVDLREHAALLDACGLSDEVDRDLCLDRLVEPYLVQVDVRQPAARNLLLVVLEHRRMRRLLAVEDDVEDRVRARVAGQRAPELTLGHAERVRRLAASVEDTGDHALSAQAPCVGGPAPFAGLHLELDSFSGHFGAEV
jgi:hypothetical protein